MGDAMADGACLIAQGTAGTEGAKMSKLVLSAPSPAPSPSSINSPLINNPAFVFFELRQLFTND
jgi:hypothetical protein